jgi:hypothetical protein
MNAQRAIVNTTTRTPGFKKVDMTGRLWSGIQVRFFERYPMAGESWVDMQSRK